MKNGNPFCLFLLLMLMLFETKAQIPFSIIKPTFTCYNTAMGKGRGIIFRFQVSSPNKKKLRIDSLYINSMSLPFFVKKMGNTFFVEANYLKNINEPILDYSGNKDQEDAIVLKHQFNPAWIVVNVNGRHKKIPIVNFKEITSN